MNKFKYFRWQISLKVLGDCFPEALSAITDFEQHVTWN